MTEERGDRAVVTAVGEHAADGALPQGTAHLHVNQPDGPDPAAFIDATAAVTDIRIETV